MKNELKVNGTQKFMGIDIPVIEGGFGENQKVILAKTVAEIHNQPLKKINQLINDNIDEFEFGIDILDLKSGYLQSTEFLEDIMSKQSIANSSNIYLLSEQGYMLLVGFMKTEKSKEIRKKLRREYFDMRQMLNEVKQQKAMLLLQIYDGGQNAVSASKKLTEIEVKEATAPLIAENEELKPKASYYDIVLQSPSLVKIGVIASDYGMSATKMNAMLHDIGIQYKQSDIWLLYSKYRGKGYTQTKTHVYGDDKTKVWMYWTQKGRLFIYDTLKAQGILPLVEQYD